MPRPLESLSAVQRGKIRRITRPAEAEEGQGGEVNVVPFLDILMNVLMFVLATLAVTFTATVDAGVAVGMAGGQHDYAQLTSCVDRLKAAFPEFAAERGVVVSANPDIPYHTVIATLDALRKTGDRELFPEVSFAIPR